jgi:hypothetical protein
MHPVNSNSNPSRGVLRIQELKKLLEQYFLDSRTTVSGNHGLRTSEIDLSENAERLYEWPGRGSATAAIARLANARFGPEMQASSAAAWCVLRAGRWGVCRTRPFNVHQCSPHEA